MFGALLRSNREHYNALHQLYHFLARVELEYAVKNIDVQKSNCNDILYVPDCPLAWEIVVTEEFKKALLKLDLKFTPETNCMGFKVKKAYDNL